jgi:hypothetical protein
MEYWSGGVMEFWSDGKNRTCYGVRVFRRRRISAAAGREAASLINK